MAEFASLADVKAHLNITSAAHDGELTLMLDAADELVRSFVGSFTPVAVTEQVAAIGGTVLLGRRPVSDVSLVDAYGTAVTGFTTNSAAGLLQSVPPVYGPLTVTYSVGAGMVPAAVKLATLIIAGHLWETQRGASTSPLNPVDDSFGIAPGVGFAIPNRAKELLAPYVRTSQIA